MGNLLRSKLTRQTTALFVSQILLLPIGVATGIINARFLGPDNYGVYSFILAIMAFFNIFFDFGIFTAGARLIALAQGETSERQMAGSLIVFGVGTSLTFGLCIFGLSFVVDHLFKTNIKQYLMLLSFPAVVMPFESVVGQIYRGANRIKEMAILQLFPKIIYLVAVFVFVTISKLDVLGALMLNLCGVLIFCVCAGYWLRPDFRMVKKHMGIIMRETREYGFNVYLGRVADTSTYNTDKMFIARFVDTTQVGFYSIATTLVSPMVMLSSSLSTSLFRDFTRGSRIDRKVIVANFAWLVFCVACLAIVGKYVIMHIFGRNYLPAVGLVMPLAMAGMFQGLYTPFNMFLSARRQGRELRLISFTEAAFNIVGNFVLIRFWGAFGAAIASAVAKGLELALNLHFYRKLTRLLASEAAVDLGR